jgi:hypothetical protein
MKNLPIFSTLLVSFVLLIFASQTMSQVTIDPVGMSFRLDQGDETATSLTVSNGLADVIYFNIRMENVRSPGRDQGSRTLRNLDGSDGPSRDRRGDPDDNGYEWRDNDEGDCPDYEWMTQDDFEDNQVTIIQGWGDDSNTGPYQLGFNFTFYGTEFNTIRVCSNGWASFTSQSTHYSWDNIELPSNANNIPENAFVIAGTDWYPPEGGGVYWIATNGDVAVISWENVAHISQRQIRWTFQIQIYASGLVKYIYSPDNFQRGVERAMTVGFQNANRDRGRQFFHGNDDYLRPEGGRAIIWGQSDALLTWLRFQQMRGAINGQSEREIPVTISAIDQPEGVFETLCRFSSVIPAEEPENVINLGTIEFTVVMTVGDNAGTIDGNVSGSRSGDPIEGARISWNDHSYIRSSDEEGNFDISEIPVGDHNFSITATDYLPALYEVELGQNGAELNAELLYSECVINADTLQTELAPDTDVDMNFSVNNPGDGPLSYRIDKRLIGDANAAPWELRRNYNVGQIVDDDRIEGVAFDGEHIVLAGAASDDPNTIYVLNTEGELIDSYNQLGQSRYGMKDLEYDGEAFWGCGESNIWAFDIDGNEVRHFQGPYNPSNNVAYDSDRDWLWIAGSTTDLQAYDREGRAMGRRLLRKNLRISGLSYWPDDPDGYCIYIYDSPGQGAHRVYKMHPITGDTLLARTLPTVLNTTPGGLFITNTFDVYSWVMMSMNSVPPDSGNDRLEIYQLDSRRDWFSVEPSEGVIFAGEDEEFTLHLDATGLPTVLFEAELVFQHDGIGTETHLPIKLDVVSGPVHSVRIIPLSHGWNLISANLQPDEVDIRALLDILVQEGSLIRMKDDEGHFFSPSQDFNNIPGWSVSEGYAIKVNRATQISLEGMTVMSDDTLHLSEGWQAVSYYPRRDLDAAAGFATIAEHLIIAKDGMGRFYMPAQEFNSIGALTQGQGYMVDVDQDVDLIYLQMAGAASAERYFTAYDRPGRYVQVPPTGLNMSLLLTAEESFEGDIGIYSDGLLVGSGFLERGKAGIAIWGDDPTTSLVDGAQQNGRLEIKLKDDTGERPLVFKSLSGELVYQTDGLAIGNVSEDLSPLSFRLVSAFPNPFNSRLTISFETPDDSRVRVAIYDLAGRVVDVVADKDFRAGRHAAVVDGEGLASGLYLLRLQSAGKSVEMKIVLMK